jgi:tetratricopeptide (TPR) repeat protein
MEEAADHLEEALTLFRKAGDRRGESVTLRHLGNLHYQGGDHAGAQRHWEASLYLCRELGNSEDLCSCLNNLGLVHFERSHYATAERLYREALELRTSLNPKSHQIANTHDNLAELYLDLDQPGRAEEEVRLAEQIADELDAAAILTELWAKRARIAAAGGDIGGAREHARRAIAMAEPTGDVESLVEALLASAEVELAGERWKEANRTASQARDLARWSRMLHWELRAALTAARAAWMGGALSEPMAEVLDLARRAEEREYRALAARIHDLTGEIHAKAGDWEDAAAEFVRAADLMKEILSSLGEEDRRSLVHHPDWKTTIGNLLDTLMRLGRREEALGYLVALGVGSCEVEPGGRGAPAVTEAGI